MSGKRGRLAWPGSERRQCLPLLPGAKSSSRGGTGLPSPTAPTPPNPANVPSWQRGRSGRVRGELTLPTRSGNWQLEEAEIQRQSSADGHKQRAAVLVSGPLERLVGLDTWGRCRPTEIMMSIRLHNHHAQAHWRSGHPRGWNIVLRDYPMRNSRALADWSV